MGSREELTKKADELYDAIGTRVFREEFRALYAALFEGAHTPTDTTIPRYAMLDLHAALYGVDVDFDAFYEEHGYAEAWSRLLGAVRELRAAPTDDEREALRDAIDHVEGGIDFQDAISSEALRVLISAVRRTEVPEPSAEHQEHADARRAETMTLISHSEPSAPMSLADDPMRKPFLKKRAEPQGEPSDALRDAIDHIQGAVEFQDAINHEAVHVVIAAALRAASADRPICEACGVPFHLIQHDVGCDMRKAHGQSSDARLAVAQILVSHGIKPHNPEYYGLIDDLAALRAAGGVR